MQSNLHENCLPFNFVTGLWRKCRNRMKNWRYSEVKEMELRFELDLWTPESGILYPSVFHQWYPLVLSELQVYPSPLPHSKAARDGIWTGGGLTNVLSNYLLKTPKRSFQNPGPFTSIFFLVCCPSAGLCSSWNESSVIYRAVHALPSPNSEASPTTCATVWKVRGPTWHWF